jgi:hypothetical protein
LSNQKGENTMANETLQLLLSKYEGAPIITRAADKSDREIGLTFLFDENLCQKNADDSKGDLTLRLTVYNDKVKAILIGQDGKAIASMTASSQDIVSELYWWAGKEAWDYQRRMQDEEEARADAAAEDAAQAIIDAADQAMPAIFVCQIDDL